MKCKCSNTTFIALGKDALPETAEYFQEVSVMEILKIPDVKPDVEAITSIMADPVVLSTKLIKTPTAVSYEGQNLSGYKIIVELEIPQRVKYVADTCCQSVHSAHYNHLMKSAFIVIPEKVNGQDISQLIRRENFSVKPYVLHIYSKMINKRTMLKYMTILVDLRFCL